MNGRGLFKERKRVLGSGRGSPALLVCAVGLVLIAQMGVKAKAAEAPWQQVMTNKGCRINFAERNIKDKDVLACAQKMSTQPFSQEEINVFLNPSDASVESQITVFIKDVVGEVQAIIDRADRQVATRVNHAFEMFRDGKSSKSSVSVRDLLARLAAESSRLKLTMYIVALMEVGQKAQTLLPNYDPRSAAKALSRDEEVKLATQIVDLMEAEMCLRGYTLPTVWWLDRQLCRANQSRYQPWSEITYNSLVNSRFKQLFNDPKAWTRNQVFLLKNGPLVDSVSEPSLFDSRMALLEGDDRWIEGDLWGQMQAAGITQADIRRRVHDPYNVLFMWGFYDDAIGLQYARYFTSRQKDGARQYGIIDRVIAGGDGHRATTSRLSSAPFLLGQNPPESLPGAGMHRKALAVDAKFAVLGGRNFGYLYTKYWRDTDVLIAGPAAKKIGEVFAAADRNYSSIRASERNTFLDADSGRSNNMSAVEVWQQNDNSPEVEAFHQKMGTNGEEVLVLDYSPRIGGEDHILAAHLYLLNQAAKGSTVYIENAYVVLTPPLREALRAALKRGVKIAVHTNSALTSDEAVVTMPIMLSVKEILEMPGLVGAPSNAATVYLRQARYRHTGSTASHNLLNRELSAMRPNGNTTVGNSQPSTLHSKYMLVVDGNGVGYSIVTSYNLHPRSHRFEDELAVVVKSARPSDPKSTYAQLKNWFFEKDPLVSKVDPSLYNRFGTVAESLSTSIPLLGPVSWVDPRALPKGGTPAHGRWVFVNNLVALTMTLGFEQL